MVRSCYLNACVSKNAIPHFHFQFNPKPVTRNPQPHPPMRPTKLTPALLDAFRTVIADEWAALAFTEEELVWQANQHLPETDRITYRTYQRYKAEILETQDAICETQDARHKTQDLLHDNEDEREIESENEKLVRDMHDTLKEALLAQKKALVRGICEGQPNWRRYTWLLERKFPDFRLKQLTDVLTKPKEPVNKEENEALKKGDAELKDKQRREAWIEKMDAHKAEEAERMKDPAYKWQRKGGPWKPRRGGGYDTMHIHELKALEEEMARDVAAGYQNPYAHLGYRPDPVERTSGIYLIMGMGEDRLPLRAHVCRVADAPYGEEREALWLAQEQERRNIIRAEQGLPPENLPEPPAETPTEHEGRGRNRIYGHSGMGN